jgi:aminoglycoside/choline kinase family phosphotransferase
MVELARVLPSCGLRIPQLYAHSSDAQVMLFEDCGDITFASALNHFEGVKDAHGDQVQRTHEALSNQHGDAWGEALFKQAIGMISVIQKIPPSAQLITHRRWLPFENLRREANEFIQYVAQPRGASRGALTALGKAMDGLCETMSAFPKAVTHFDFHAYNLMIRPDGELVVIDFQDMSLGSPARDLVSLINDRGMDERLGRSLHSRLYQHAEQSLGYEPGVFQGYYDVTLLHWDFRVSGRFIKLTAERGTDRYKQWIPGTLRRLGRTLTRSYKRVHGLEDVLDIATKLCPEVREGVEDCW